MSAPDEAGRAGFVIAIDGPAASGKSSTAQWVAQRLGFRHIDSGALYRAATAAALRSGAPPDEWTPDDVLRAGERAECQRDHAGRVAQMGPVRAWVNAQVRAAAAGADVVVDGRDIGTTVLPEAALKVYLVADPWERARRRLTQRLQRVPADDEIAHETDLLVKRDAADAPQSSQAPDAVLIDTTYLTQEEQVERIVALAKAATRVRES